MLNNGKTNTLKLGKIAPITSIFSIYDNEHGTGEIIRFEQNGDILVKGKLIENDKQVVDAFREFLKFQKFL